GNELLYEYCLRTGVPYRRTGKLVVALAAGEEPALEDLYSHACLVGAKVELLSGHKCKELEPLVTARAALYSYDTGIVDSESLMRALYTQGVTQGVAMLFATPLLSVDKGNDGYQLRTPHEVISARIVINCAGLASDQIANLVACSLDKPAYQLYYCKGEYYCLRRRLPINHLIYPLPGQHSLGVHLTMDLAGNLRLGPNAYYVDTVDYTLDNTHAEEFYHQAKAMLPGLTPDDILPGYTGIRPKLHSADQHFSDFVIADECSVGYPGWINLVGIESPGLTACLAIAEEVACLIKPYR
ncbi:MAG: NAD(P)/FAD-dependent oxidoreductase, partial [Methanomassiliicoccales archaeon]